MDKFEEINTHIKKILQRCINYYGERLLSFVIYGSVARGDYSANSDIDLLIVIDEERSSCVSKRIDEFREHIISYAEEFELFRDLYEKGLPHRVEVVIWCREGLLNHPSLMLDMVDDAKIIFDRDNIMQNELQKVRQRLKELGSKRIYLKDGSWFWILKPDIKWGENIKI
jgi:hypothetical protein